MWLRCGAAMALTVFTSTWSFHVACPQEASAGRPDPARALTGAEAEKLVADAVTLVDKGARPGERADASEALYRLHHRAALPAFRFVLHNESDHAHARVGAIRDVLRIGLAEPIGDIVRLLGSRDVEVRRAAHRMLCWQHAPGRDFAYDVRKPPAENATAIQRWEEWWEASKDTFELNELGIWLQL